MAEPGRQPRTGSARRTWGRGPSPSSRRSVGPMAPPIVHGRRRSGAPQVPATPASSHDHTLGESLLLGRGCVPPKDPQVRGTYFARDGNVPLEKAVLGPTPGTVVQPKAAGEESQA